MTADDNDVAGPALEVGWLRCTAGADDDSALPRLPVALREDLEAVASGYAWAWREYESDCGLPDAAEVPVMDLVDIGLAFLDTDELDFLFIVTTRPLLGRRGERVRAATASAAGVAVISTADWASAGATQTLCSGDLPLRLFGQLVGVTTLPGVDDGRPDAAGPKGPNRPRGRDEGALREALARVADPRIEERGRRGRLAFYLGSIAENWRQILISLVRVQPWLMPLRLGRLTTAAASTLFVLLVTAEGWELGMAQSGTTVTVLALVALVGTSAYVLQRHRLLVPWHGLRLREQIVAMQTAVALGVVAGLASTYLVLFGVTLLAAWSLFPPALVSAWSGIEQARTVADYLILSAFFSAVGVIIGALGASFEDQVHLRQLALIDREYPTAVAGEVPTGP